MLQLTSYNKQMLMKLRILRCRGIKKFHKIEKTTQNNLVKTWDWNR